MRHSCEPVALRLVRLVRQAVAEPVEARQPTVPEPAEAFAEVVLVNSFTKKARHTGGLPKIGALVTGTSRSRQWTDAGFEHPGNKNSHLLRNLPQ